VTIGKQIAVGFGIALAAQAVVVGLTWVSTVRLADRQRFAVETDSQRFLVETNRWVAHAHEVIAQLQGLLLLLDDAENGARGFVLTGDLAFLEPYQDARERIDRTLKQLRELTRDNPAQQRRLDGLEPKVKARLAILADIIERRRQQENGFEKAVVEIRTGRGKAAMDEVREAVSDLENEERTLLVQRNKAAEEKNAAAEKAAEEKSAAAEKAVRSHLQAILGAAVAAAVVLLLVGVYLTRSVTVLSRQERNREATPLAQTPTPPLSASAREATVYNAPTPSAPQPLPEVLGSYRLLDKLGEGGMGAVYRAFHVRLKRMVALKILPGGLLDDAQAVARFQREMEAGGKLDHPNIVRASDAGEAGGRHFLVMELIDGVDLARLASRLGPLPVADVCEAGRQVAQALQHAHEHGLVHRDVKPSNLILTPAGAVKLLDLGLARLYGNQPNAEGLTASGAAMGTPDYMAPEQALEPKKVDIRADLYSLGCTLYRLLTGRPPFGDPPYDTAGKKMMAHAQAPVPAVRGRRPDVPERLAGVLERLLAKSPADRFGTPAEVAAVLKRFAVGHDLPRLLAAALAGRGPLPEAETREHVEEGKP